MSHTERRPGWTTRPGRLLASLLTMTLLLAGIGLLGGCGSSGLDRPVIEATAVPQDGVQTAELTLHSFYFVPSRIIVRANVPVELKLKKKSFFVPHNFSLYAPEAGIKIDQNIGTLGFLPGSKTVRFTPTRPGEYEFFCDKGHHAEKGMKGVLVVQP